MNTNISEHYIRCGEWEKAIEHDQSALDECAHMTSVYLLEGTSWLGLARAYQGLERYRDAAVAIRRAALLFEKAGTPARLAEAQLVRAELALAVGRSARAERICDQALEAVHSLGNAELESAVHRILGRLALARAEYARAEELYRTSIAGAEHCGAAYQRGLGLLGLAEVYAAWDDAAAGRKPFRRTLRKAIRVLDGVGARAAAERARELAPPDLAATL